MGLSRLDFLKLPQRSQRAVHRLGLTAILLEAAEKLVGAEQRVTKRVLNRLRFFEQSRERAGLVIAVRVLAIAIGRRDWLRRPAGSFSW